MHEKKTKTKRTKVSFSYLSTFEFSKRRSAISPPRLSVLTACVTHGYAELDRRSSRWIQSCEDNHPESQSARVTCRLLALLVLFLKTFDTLADWQQLILAVMHMRGGNILLTFLTTRWSGASIVLCGVADLFQTQMPITDNFKQPIRENKLFHSGI